MIEQAIRAAVREELRAELPTMIADALEQRQQRTLATREECANYLRISTRSLDTLRAQGLPTIWVIESPRFDLEEVRAWLVTHNEKTPPGDEPSGVNRDETNDAKRSTRRSKPVRK